jgi:DNA polymerase III delta prime subunit
MSKISKLWCEKYRPETIDDIIFKDPNVKNQMKSIAKLKEIPNLLFSGVQGSGKTSLSIALVNECGIHPEDILVINASDEQIDAMRDKVTVFSRTMPLGEYKIVRLEEMDHLSLSAQAILRKIIEDSSATCRFICTCNYANKIIPALKSRRGSSLCDADSY